MKAIEGSWAATSGVLSSGQGDVTQQTRAAAAVATVKSSPGGAGRGGPASSGIAARASCQGSEGCGDKHLHKSLSAPGVAPPQPGHPLDS